MRFMVIYGSTNGHARKLSKIVAARLGDLGHQIELLDSTRELIVLDIGSFDAVIIASSVHQGRHQKSITDFASTNLKELQKRPTMLISVSLSSAFQEGEAAAQSYVEYFINQTGLEPNKISKVASRLPDDHHSFFLDQIAEHSELIIEEKPKPVTEFTDWIGLETEVREFVEFVSGDPPVSHMWSEPPSGDMNQPEYGRPTPRERGQITSEVVKLFCGERICIEMTRLFRKKISTTTTFLSMDLPEWLDLDEKSGEMNGIVPEYSDDHHPVEFTVYTVDHGDLSAKAKIALECCNKIPTPITSDMVFEFSEGDTVILGTVKFFVESGLNIDGYLFAETGLPAGLEIKRENGVITGTIEAGTAREELYKVEVSATEPKADGCGASINLYLNVS